MIDITEGHVVCIQRGGQCVVTHDGNTVKLRVFKDSVRSRKTGAMEYTNNILVTAIAEKRDHNHGES